MARRPDAAEKAGYRREAFEAGGIRHAVYRGGDGPPVLLLHEMPSLSWRTISLGDLIRDRGYRVVMPRFGRFVAGRTRGAAGATNMLRGSANAIWMCVSWQFVVLAQNRTSPVAGWLQALARSEQAARAATLPDGMPAPVGVVGMCFSGGFALATAVDPSIGVAISSQPSLPFASGLLRRIPGQATDPGVSRTDLARLADRSATGDLCVRAYRYSNDPIAPVERIERLVEALGPGITFVPIQLEDEDRPSHPVLSDAATVEGDGTTPAHKARAALDDLLNALDERLKPAQA
jgi:dienelactone hydrolase